MKYFKRALTVFFILFGSIYFLSIINQCTTKQQPAPAIEQPATSTPPEYTPEELESIAFLTSVRIQEILDDPTKTALEKIDLINQATDVWGCTEKGALNYDPDAKYNCCCTYAAEPGNNN